MRRISPILLWLLILCLCPLSLQAETTPYLVDVGFIPAGSEGAPPVMTGRLLDGDPAALGLVVYIPYGEAEGPVATPEDDTRYIFPLDEQGWFEAAVPVPQEEGQVDQNYELFLVSLDGDWSEPDYQTLTQQARGKTIYSVRIAYDELLTQAADFGEVVAMARNSQAAVPAQETPMSEQSEAPAALADAATTVLPSEAPTPDVTAAPTTEPTAAATAVVTEAPTAAPTVEPTAEPTEAPTEAPTAEPTEAPTEVPTEEPTPEVTEQPVEATPEPASPTEAPALPEAQSAEALLESAWTLALSGAQQDYAFEAALKSWLLENRSTEEVEGVQQEALSLPSFRNVSLRALPYYKGTDPVLYLPELATALESLIAELPAGDTLPVDASMTPETLAEALASEVLEPASAWLDDVLSETQGYSAMSRLLLDNGQEESFWRQVAFEQRNQAPLYASNDDYRTLQRGDRSTDVERMQTALVEQGYLDGDIDGRFGKGTEAAVIAFETAEGLEADGRMTALELRTLYGEPQPFFLPTLLASQSAEAISSWWPSYLQAFRSVQWQDGILTLEVPQVSPDGEAWYGEWQSQFESGEAQAENIRASFAYLLLDALQSSETTEVLTIHLPIDRFLAPDLSYEQLLDEQEAAALMDPIVTLSTTLEAQVEEAVAHASAR